MKITRSDLRELIREEIARELNEIHPLAVAAIALPVVLAPFVTVAVWDRLDEQAKKDIIDIIGDWRIEDIPEYILQGIADMITKLV